MSKYRVTVWDGEEQRDEYVIADDFVVVPCMFNPGHLTLTDGDHNLAYYPPGRWVDVVRVDEEREDATTHEL